MKYECLYVKTSGQFVVAKPSPAVWGEGELSATFTIVKEELTTDELKAKYDKVLADAKAVSDALIAKRKAEAEAKAVKK